MFILHTGHGIEKFKPNGGVCLQVFDHCFIVKSLVSFLIFQSSRWGRKSLLVYMYYILMSCGCLYSVFLPRGVVGWSAV